MERIEKCPVCGTENKRIYDTLEYMICEDHYYCNKCGYFSEMAYSPVHDGIELKTNFNIIPQLICLFKYRKNTKGLKLGRSYI